MTKLTILNKGFFNEAGDSPDGGGSTVGLFADLEIPQDEPEKQSESKEEQEQQDQDDDINLASFLKSETGKKKKKEEPEQKQEEQAKEEEKKESQEEKDPLDISEDDLVDSQGKPVTAASKDAFKKVKDAALRLRAELEEAKKNSVPTQEIEQLKADLAKYKNIVESEFFEKDPSFIEKFVKPRDKAKQRAATWLESLSEEDKNESIPLIGAAGRIIADRERVTDEKSEMEFSRIVDQISEKMTPSAARKFSDAMLDWFEGSKRYYEAVSDKEKTSAELAKAKSEHFEKTNSSIASIIDSSIEGWQKINEQRVKFYSENGSNIGYSDSVNQRAGAIKEGLKHFQLTGTISPEFARIIVDGGIVGESYRKSEEVLAKTLRGYGDVIKKKDERIQELEGKLRSLAGDDDGRAARSGGFDSDDKSGDEENLASFLRKNLRKAKIS